MNINLLIRSLISHLPRFAEEEGDFYSVPREALINGLCEQHPLDRATAENTIALLETLLDTLAVLNTAYLQKGEWCFVSFPAQLMATSILTALSDTESRLFAPNFWTTQGISSDKRDQQHDVLRFVENSRNEHHASQLRCNRSVIVTSPGVLSNWMARFCFTSAKTHKNATINPQATSSFLHIYR